MVCIQCCTEFFISACPLHWDQCEGEPGNVLCIHSYIMFSFQLVHFAVISVGESRVTWPAYTSFLCFLFQLVHFTVTRRERRVT